MPDGYDKESVVAILEHNQGSSGRMETGSGGGNEEMDGDVLCSSHSEIA